MTNYILEEERKTAKKVFEGMVDVIKLYKDSDAYLNVSGEYCTPVSEEILQKNDEVEVIIMKSRFDLPKEVHEELESLFFEIASTEPNEIQEENEFARGLKVERLADEYYERLCEILKAYVK